MSYGRPAGLPVVDAMTPPVLVLSGPLTPGEVSGPCEALRALLDGGGAVVSWCATWPGWDRRAWPP